MRVKERYDTSIERWEIFESLFPGPAGGNPFTEITFGATFQFRNRHVPVDGFYDGCSDGGGLFRLRFMPDTLGVWEYETHSNVPELDGKRGVFNCIPPSTGNHGPVRIAETYHFRYEDGTPYVPVGTTCYAWIHQGGELERETLETLRRGPFNKLRMCVFPKDYLFNKNEPARSIFEKKADGNLDFDKPNAEYFQHLDLRVGELRDMGIEADIILFHPYDRWGYADMSAEQDERYLKYIVARLAAYRNVWWSFANEYDLMKSKATTDWDRFFRLVQIADPCGHFRSIHNCRTFYDHGKPWVTHCSIQSSELDRTGEWRDCYRKPVILDECRYEGNIHRSWGNITAREMSHRFWEVVCRGGYAGHGETYVHPQDILWWAKGGVLYGQSPERIAFLRSILEQSPVHAMEPVTAGKNILAVGKPGEFYLVYFGIEQPAYKELSLPEDISFMVEIVDTWQMKISRLAGEFCGDIRIDLPSQQYMALRITRI